MVSNEGNEEDAITAKSKIKRYLSRPISLEDVSYLTWLRDYDWYKYRLRGVRGAKPRVLNYYPVYREQEEVARVKLTLHHPFRKFSSFSEAYSHCRVVYTHPDDKYGKELDTSEDDALFEDIDDPIDNP
ncbi:hypothetical protein N7495_006660 [Penicillium taxi]|uniref:uncharacterized protein n=1 Tax=Penicillium taxi TaxID=168475 RepID=UPI002544F6AB|nr:uncharacterized protein N7495_006660 [Penicillium taxi]KAJ5894969.1 hypothetical protein N7495_006660 [Penicillium taxi]